MSVNTKSTLNLSDISFNIERLSKADELPNRLAIESIVEYCSIQGAEVSENVACSDKIELIKIRSGFAKDVLSLDAATAEKGIQRVCEAMKDAYPKRRVTFLYLLAETTDSLETLASYQSAIQANA